MLSKKILYSSREFEIKMQGLSKSRPDHITKFVAMLPSGEFTSSEIYRKMISNGDVYIIGRRTTVSTERGLIRAIAASLRWLVEKQILSSSREAGKAIVFRKC